MSSEPVITALPSPATPARACAGSTPFADYWALTKPEVNFLILITTFVGFYLGAINQARPVSYLSLINTLLGTLLVAGGTGTLNQYIERTFDAQMRRTARRPLAAGRLHPSSVLTFGIALSTVGSIYLAVSVGLLASLLALLTLLSYLFLYTPLKRRTPFCVLVGAFPGAMPPLIGYAAATGRLSLEAWTLFAILFLWQFPHFMAIAWMYREDYERAGYLVLPQGKARNFVVILQTILPLALLITVSTHQYAAQHPAISFMALVLGLAFLNFALEFAVQRSRMAARRLLMASIVYLPVLFVLIAMVVRSGQKLM